MSRYFIIFYVGENNTYGTQSLEVRSGKYPNHYDLITIIKAKNKLKQVVLINIIELNKVDSDNFSREQ